MIPALTTFAEHANVLKNLIHENRLEAEQAALSLADKRKAVDEAIVAIEKQYADENFNLLLQQKEATESATSYDQQLRELAVSFFNETGEKRLDADVSVRVNTKFQYDNTTAVAWAEINAPVLIVKTVDKKSFESLPQVAALDFVEKVETVSAVIAKEFTTL